MSLCRALFPVHMWGLFCVHVWGLPVVCPYIGVCFVGMCMGLPVVCQCAGCLPVVHPWLLCVTSCYWRHMFYTRLALPLYVCVLTQLLAPVCFHHWRSPVMVAVTLFM